MSASPYRAFLEAKACVAPSLGFDVDPAAINPALKPHTRLMVRWALKGGRRAWFASFGLHKTATQIEAMRLVGLHTGGRPTLIVLPLGVRQEFVREGHRRFAGAFAVRIKFIRSAAEIEPGTIHLTNYETIRDGKLDPGLFAGVSLDEAACLRGFGGSKTFREFMRLFDADTGGGRVPYRFVATATPSPNEHIELLAYSAFLGVMDVGQSKTRFFKRNSEKADTLTIHPHKTKEFWLWVASWALFVQKPSDLDPSFSDAGYDLPALNVRWHELPTERIAVAPERDGQGRLFANASIGVADASRVKRTTLDARVARITKILEHERFRGPSSLHEGVSGEEPGDVAGQATRARSAGLSKEPRALQGQVESLEGKKPGADARTPDTASLAERRSSEGTQSGVVSQQQGARGRDEPPPQVKTVRPDGRDISGAAGGAGGVLRDLPVVSRPVVARLPTVRGSLPSDRPSSRLALPSLQLGTGTLSGRSPSAHEGSGLPDQVIIWCDLNDEQIAIERALTATDITVTSLYGNQPVDLREQLLGRWLDRDTSAFLTKPMMYGAGVNLQQCHTMIFAGIGFKFADFVQAIHRAHRFGQEHDVTIHLIYSEAERDVRASLERKWAQHEETVATMTALIREYGLTDAAMAAMLVRAIGVERIEVAGEGYRCINNDCVEELARHDADSVDLIVTSIPFAEQYEYSPNYADFGHTDDAGHFWRQMDYLIPHLLRVLRPGRCAMIHVKDRIVPGGINKLGFQTVYPFSDDCIAAFKRHGFAFLARKTITTDVVRENNQTYRLGWTEQCKDGSRMGCGLPEYGLLFRKAPSDLSDGYADSPVAKAKPDVLDPEAGPVAWGHGLRKAQDERRRPVPGTGYSRGRWQLDAHGFARSAGDRLLTAAEWQRLDPDLVYKAWKAETLALVYDFEHHVRIAEDLDAVGRLPPTFMLLPPHSWHPDVWSDVTRMLGMNTLQVAQNREPHVCPMQFDFADRAIAQLSEPGETVLDPFAGLMTVPYRALKLGRRGIGIELSPSYFADGVAYVRAAAEAVPTPSLFDFLAAEPAPVAAE